MPTTGARFPTSGTNFSLGLTAWTGPGNIVSDNATDATNTNTSDQLCASIFGFSVHEKAIIQGVIVLVEASEHSTSTENLQSLLQSADGTTIGTSITVNISGTAQAIYTFGSATNLWGAGAVLTAALINSSGFGVLFTYATAHDLRIDYVTMEIIYSIPLDTRLRTQSVKRSNFY